MTILTFCLVIVMVLIFVGLLFKRITWDRAIILALVTMIVAAAIWFLLGGGVVGP